MTPRTWEIVLLSASALAALPVLVLWVECLASLGRRRSPKSAAGASPGACRLAVLIPAHNEEDGIGATVESIRPQLSPADRILVVADNCTDQTAQRARAAGATVFERNDLSRRGKVAALTRGLEVLSEDPADILILVDADTPVGPGSIPALAQAAARAGRPMQAVYLLSAPSGAGVKTQLSALAFAIKNFVRPRGLARLGIPCPLVGTGMALPWGLLERARFAEHSIVEDLQLGIDLAIAGYPAELCEDASVTGYLPQADHAAKVQRRRWEHGHLRTILTQVPRLIGRALRTGRITLVAMAMDLAVPPLSLVALVWGAVATASGVAAVRGGMWRPLWTNAAVGFLLATAVLVAWGAHLRKQVRFLTLLGLPLYILWKIPLYIGFLLVRETRWVRTPREGDRGTPGPPPPSP